MLRGHCRLVGGDLLGRAEGASMITREGRQDIHLGIALACFVILLAAALVVPVGRWEAILLGVVGLDLGYGIGRGMR